MKQIKETQPLDALLQTAAASLLVTVCTLFSGVLIARLLGPESRGYYGVLMLVAQTAASLASLSFFDGVIVKLRSQSDQLHRQISTMTLVGLLLFSLGIISAYTYVASINFIPPGMSEIEVIGICGALIFITIMWQGLSSADRIKMHFSTTNFERVMGPFLFSILLSFFWVIWPERISVSLVFFFYILARLPAYLWWIPRYSKYMVGPIDWSFAKKAGKTGIGLHFGFCLAVLAAQSDRLYASAYFSPEQLGQYFVAFSTVGIVYTVIIQAINTVLFPYLSGLDQHERNKVVPLLIRLSCLLSLVGLMVGVAVLPSLIPLVYGEQYTRASEVAMLLLFSNAVLPVKAVVLEANRATGEAVSSAEMNAVGLFVMLFFFVVFDVQTLGALIAAYGLSNALSLLSGIRYLMADGSVRFDSSLLPKASDIKTLTEALRR